MSALALFLAAPPLGTQHQPNGAGRRRQSKLRCYGESSSASLILVGLSATHHNYQDALWPQAAVIGVTGKKAITRYQITNIFCYENVLSQAGRNQTLVFVHSRKVTSRAACFGGGVKDRNSRDLLPFAFTIHHAGMTREDRSVVEELFADGSVQVLVFITTLAWSVNLPSHTMIINGPQIYAPEKGRWGELSSQDRLPIDSQFIAKLADNLNAKIVLGTCVRMLKSPSMYGVGADYQEDDIGLIQERTDNAQSAAVLLEKCSLIKYEGSTSRFTSTELGRIASHYYITYNSMMVYS
ncbi:hypothetical protein HYPSUDRAFT_203727 [Hypholoma sublateritium FD-334 SS-4]|uniref:Helicase C-terminal domain-containing protein n=1 Tax=Hypholoma sublateritium (strain FD-334 SS-4) TaxID=945553 RepID=A0A0D2NP71_HYPSF|nr:hypothetical protein HYPSUDRAFT_203727 [Hypholoma sublateritium FD-334 SS-4]